MKIEKIERIERIESAGFRGFADPAFSGAISLVPFVFGFEGGAPAMGGCRRSGIADPEPPPRTRNQPADAPDRACGSRRLRKSR